MKKRAAALLMTMVMAASCLAGCGSTDKDASNNTVEENTQAAENTATDTESDADADQKAADDVAALIDAIYVQERTDDTDAQCEAAKAAWDALTDAQKELVEGENADPDYFGRDTGDASMDDQSG